MEQLILLGDEAVAQGAIDAGLRGAFAYPGTPSTEIFEYVESHLPDDRPLWARWSTNEKVAYEEAIGMSFAGGRAIVSMKHVGLNVAADPFMNSAITGVNAGLVLAVADDPGMHSSQNEQDSRYYADFASVPCLEPSTQQEAYDMAYRAFELSEELGLPVLMRLVTRLSHSRAIVQPRERKPQAMKPVVGDRTRFNLLPVNSRRKWAALKDRWTQVEEAMASLPWNRLELRGTELGIIASGVAWNYMMEVLESEGLEHSWLKVGAFPMPRELVRALFDHCDEILVIEDGYPFMESRLKGALDTPPKPVHGKLDGWLPRTGELNPTHVRKALGLDPLPTLSEPLRDLAPRPPALCPGCPHADTFLALNDALKDQPSARVFSDIGCYTLGALPPFEAIHTCVDMGASLSMAVGAAATGLHPSIAVIGDSTFAHSGITPLLDAINHGVNLTLVILDNSTVAMTGQQDSALGGEHLRNLLAGAGVSPEHIRVFKPIPRNHDEAVRIFREEIAYEGVSVVIPTRPCLWIRKH